MVHMVTTGLQRAKIEIKNHYYKSKLIIKIRVSIIWVGRAVAYLVQALCYKPEGRGFDSRWGH
jgi:hypothetical protein